MSTACWTTKRPPAGAHPGHSTLGGPVNADGPTITLRLSTPDAGTVLETSVPRVDDPDFYFLAALVNCDVLPYAVEPNESVVRVRLAFVGRCADDGRVSFQADGVVQYEQPLRWSF